MGDQQWERILTPGSLVDEMDVQAVDLGGEVVEPVQCGLAGAPVVLVGPVGRQILGVVQRDALGPVLDALGLGPSGPVQSLFEVVEIGFGNCDAEGADLSHASQSARGRSRGQGIWRSRRALETAS